MRCAILVGFASLVLLLTGAIRTAGAESSVLVEAESFSNRGGWQLDTQFVEAMGSPYLLAHGLGRPVEDAETTVEFPATGKYRVFVRTLDWVARWQAPGQPGKFQVLVDGRPLAKTFGTEGAQWHWQDGGTVEITQRNVELSLRDLSGFCGRCDAILFTTADAAPPNEGKVLSSWRRELLNLPDQPVTRGGYDLVVIGGGYSGMGAAISAARMGCQVALVQNRALLGGNGSSEVRVWAKGHIRRGKYPRIGEIIEEFADQAQASPAPAEQFGDALKETVIRAESRIDLFLNHHAFQVELDGAQRIQSVLAFDTRTSLVQRFEGTLFVDATGHGTMGYLAGADYDMTDKGRMGMSNMWTWAEGEQDVDFPPTPWALDLDMKDFPYPRDHHGEWFWESGFDQNPLAGAEAIRDWNLRAVFGAFNAMKNRDGAAKHRSAYLTWVAFIGGPRESRRLMGDVLLNQDDIVSKRDFVDGCVPSTWTIDLHYPKQQYAKKYPDNPFISIAEHDRRIDRAFGYPIPYRCFYSRNISNLFMVGRCISVTHEALGTTRVMKTCGMMGEVVGKAASLCVLHDCAPRDIYQHHWEEMHALLQLPGKARRDTPDGEIRIPDDALPLAGPHGPMTGIAPDQLTGTVIDDADAEKTGKWSGGGSLRGYVAYGYVYASADSGAQLKYQFTPEQSGWYEIRISYSPHTNRGSRVPVTVATPDKSHQVRINMKEKAPLDHGFIALGKFQLNSGRPVSVLIGTEDAGGIVHADAVQVLPMK